MWGFGGRRAVKITSTAPHLVYAIGDVHGRADLLAQILEQITIDAHRIPSPLNLIMLGDYIDRGPESRAVISNLVALSASPDLRLIALKGNHEDVLLRFLGDAEIGAAWVAFGGAETLASYEVDPPRPGRDWEDVRIDLLHALPPSHLDFLRTLELFAVFGDYVFVHAGVRPGVRLEDQDERDLLWMREPFLSHRSPCTHVVVHGHTPTADVAMMGCRIGVDTGAYSSGILTAVRLFGIDRRILQTPR